MIHRLWWALILCIYCSTTAAKEKPLTEVADLRYGVALYHYYQGQHFQALSDLLVAEQRGGIKGHGDNPEIMMGGFYMAYGLERTASDIFERLLDANRPQKTRDAAWLYLAQMRYLRNDWEGAHAALKHISADPSSTAASDVLALNFNLALKENRIEDARALLNRVNLRDDGTPYLFFNMAAAYAGAQDYEQAVAFYNRIADMPQRSLAHLSLYDKAMTSAGYARLFNKQTDLAVEQFKKVRLGGPFSSQALLGYGWVFAEKEDYRGALAPWQALATRTLIDKNTQEALVAIPYAYEQLGLKSAALKAYREAEAGFESEVATLDIFIQNLKGEAMLEALNIDPSEDINWLDYAKKNQLTPQLSYLTQLFSKNTFRGLTQELRDLLALQRRLEDWQTRLDFYDDMLVEREANRLLEMNFMVQQKANDKFLRMGAERQSILTHLDDIEQNNAFLALLQGDELVKLQRIERAEDNLALLAAAGQNVDQQREKLRRHRGLLLWHAGELFAERLWRARQTVKELDGNLVAAGDTQKRIQNTVDEGFDLVPYHLRIDASRVAIKAQLAGITQAISLAQQVLQAEVTSVLDAQRNRLLHHLAQSRLAIARLLDDANEEQF